MFLCNCVLFGVGSSIVSGSDLLLLVFSSGNLCFSVVFGLIM